MVPPRRTERLLLPPEKDLSPVMEERAERADELLADKSLAALMPILTLAMIFFLLIVYAIEKALAFDVSKAGDLSSESVLAFGAASYDRVFGAGEVWRLFLAPILHGSASHLVGNCIALGFLGCRLEPWIKKGWFAAIFVVSGLGGLAGSFIGNPHFLTTLGASGAISGLVGALFMMSFTYQASEEERMRMFWTSVRFGIPALAPLLWGASGNVDYYGHLGGAVAGGLMGWGLSSFWPEEAEQPENAAWAAKFAALGLALSVVSAGAAATQYSTYAAIAADMMPSALAPRKDKDITAQAFAAYGRYPKDPRARLFRAVYHMMRDHLPPAETELRAAMARAQGLGPSYKAIGLTAQGYLAIVLARQGARGEAQAQAQEICAAPNNTFKADFKKLDLCR